MAKSKNASRGETKNGDGPVGSPPGVVAELKRRNVFRVGAAYVIVAWLLLQAADIMLSNFGAPDWVFKSFVALIVLGLPMALFLAWAYELTPEGIKKTASVDRPGSSDKTTSRKLDLLIIAVLVVAVVFLVFDKFVLSTAPVGEVTVETEQDPARPDPSIAVLPFADMSPEGDQAYFADGLSEEILNLLARGGALKVTARTSSFSFKGRDVPIPEIGRTLGVAHVLEGSVRKSGNQLRITAQLIEAGTGFHLWSESFDRPLQEVFAIQDEIAGAIADALEVTLTGQAPVAENVKTYELYLQARELIRQRRPDGLEQARALIDQALELDSDYAPALAASAELWLLLSAGIGTYGDIPQRRAWSEAESQLDRALALDPELADAHAVMGLLSIQQREHARASEHLARALEINPSHAGANNWYANLLANEGMLNESIAARLRFKEVDPLFAVNLLNLATSLADAGRFEAAEEWVQRLKRQFPDRYYGYSAQAYALMCRGRLADAWRELEHALEIDAAIGSLRFHGELISLSLGSYKQWESRSIGAVWVWEPLARGEIDTALARGWQRLSLAPDNTMVIVTLLEALSVAGRYQELLDWVEQRWGDVETMAAHLGNIGMRRYLLPVAVAQRALGYSEGFLETLDLIAVPLDHLKTHGWTSPWLDFVDVSLIALGGDRDRAINALTEAIDRGYRDPRLAVWPVFEPWHDDPAFQAQVSRMTELINIERSKLGMEPLL